MENLKTTLNGFRLETEFKNVPVAFVNAIRRICLSEIPTVVVTDVEILENTSQMTHEMLRQRMETLPINVSPTDVDKIKNGQLEIRIGKVDKVTDLTTDDFGGGRELILKDRDLGEPLVFMRLQKGEAVHIKAKIGLRLQGESHVCVSTYKNHIDPKQAEFDLNTFLSEGRGTEAEFKNHHIQRSYAVDENGRPYWFDFVLESIGVLPATDILKKSAQVLKQKITEWLELPILRKEGNYYEIVSEKESHTLGNLMQTLLYKNPEIDYVSYHIDHPLLSKMIVKFQTKSEPEKVLEKVKNESLELCETILRGI